MTSDSNATSPQFDAAMQRVWAGLERSEQHSAEVRRRLQRLDEIIQKMEERDRRRRWRLF